MDGTEQSPRAQARKHGSYKMATFVGIFLPLAGFAFGLYFMMQEDPVEKALGAHTLRFSILGTILVLTLWLVLPGWV